MTPLDIMISQSNEKSTCVYEFCKKQVADMTLDNLYRLSSEYDFGFDVKEQQFELSLKIQANKILESALNKFTCKDCPQWGIGEPKNAYPQHVKAIERAVDTYLSMRERAFRASIIGVLTHTKSSITGCTTLL